MNAILLQRGWPPTTIDPDDVPQEVSWIVVVLVLFILVGVTVELIWEPRKKKKKKKKPAKRDREIIGRK